MQTIAQFNNENYIYNHLIYDDAKDKYFALHSHALYEFIYILEGEISYSIENKLYKAKKNDLLIIKPFTYHFFSIDNDKPYEKIGILFNPSFIAADKQYLNNDIEIISIQSGLIRDIFQKLDFYFKTFDEKVFTDVLLSSTREIIYNLSLIPQNTAVPHSYSPIISEAVEYINANLFTLNNIEEVSNALFISKNYFFNIFNSEMKISPKKYITEKRLLYARSMILSGKKPTDIFEQCGFSNYTTFYRSYLNFFGYSPSKENSDSSSLQSADKHDNPKNPLH